MNSVIAAFSAEQVHRLTGVSVARLIDWDNQDFFIPAFAYDNRRSPFSRIYSFEDVVGLRTLNILRDKVSMQHLRKAADCLKAHSGKPWSELTFYILNREVHFRNPNTGMVEGAVSGQFAVPIALSSVAQDMRAKVEILRKRDPATVGKVSQNRHVVGGAVVIAGTRIAVDNIRGFADAGYTPEQIVEQYPLLELADVEAALHNSGKLTLAA